MGTARNRPGCRVLARVSPITTASAALTPEIPTMIRPLLALMVVRRKASSTAKRISGVASILMRPITAFPASPTPPTRGPRTAPVRPPRTMAIETRAVGERRRNEAFCCGSFIIGLPVETKHGVRPRRGSPPGVTFQGEPTSLTVLAGRAAEIGREF